MRGGGSTALRALAVAAVAWLSLPLAWVSAVGGGPSSASALGSRPNILLMVADDLGWSDVCMNQVGPCDIHTPHLDGLARGGVRLMRHYAEPWCLPSRMALLTGRDPAKLGANFVNVAAEDVEALGGGLRGRPSSGGGGDSGKNGNDGGGAGAAAQGLAAHLAAANYFTAWVGKWHTVGDPAAHGFSYRFGSTGGQLKDYFRPGLCRYPELLPHGNRSRVAASHDRHHHRARTPLAASASAAAASSSAAVAAAMDPQRPVAQVEVAQGYATDLEAAEVERLVRSKGTRWLPGERPFFIYLAWHAPRKSTASQRLAPHGLQHAPRAATATGYR